MRGAARLAATVAPVTLCLAAGGDAAAQNADILAGAPPTSVYVETDYSENDGLENCDWYASAAELIAAEVSEFGSDCQVNIRLRGIITREGAGRFAKLVDVIVARNYRPATIVLDSRGGDGDAAISIARQIRATEAFAAVPVTARIADNYDAVCFSACVVIFAAAWERVAEFNINGDPALPSRLGIHSPGQFDRHTSRYDSSSNNSEIQRLSRRLKRFFSDIDIDPGIVDDMFAVPFDDIRLLSRADLQRYGLETN